MAERYTAEQVFEFLSDDIDISGGEESDFDGEEIYSYLPEASTEGMGTMELESSLSQGQSSGEEGETDLEDDLLHTLKDQDILMPITGKNISRYS